MAGFLSPDWFERLDRAVRSASATRRADGEQGDDELTVQFEVVGGTDGAVAYWIGVGGPSPGVTRGRHSSPDVTFRLDHGTAESINAGTAGALDAFQHGALEVQGDVGRLVGGQEVLRAAGIAHAGSGTGSNDEGADP